MSLPSAALVGLVVLVGCSNKATPVLPPPAAQPSPPVPTASALLPLARAQKIVQAQVHALRMPDIYDLRATFDRDTLLLTPDPIVASQERLELELVGSGSPHSQIFTGKPTSVHAGGNGHVVWLVADVEFRFRYGEPDHGLVDETLRYRISELLPASAGWTAVATTFVELADSPEENRRIPDVPTATQPGPLSRLLASPHELGAAFAEDPTVFAVAGSELATGPQAARTLVAKWHLLQLEGPVREVRTRDWGYLQGRAKLDGKLASVQLFALPVRDGWAIVGLHLGF